MLRVKLIYIACNLIDQCDILYGNRGITKYISVHWIIRLSAVGGIC